MQPTAPYTSPNSVHKSTFSSNQISGKYESQICYGCDFRLTVFAHDFTQEKFNLIATQLAKLVGEMERLGSSSYNYKDASKLTGIDMRELAAQTEALFTNSEYSVRLAFEMGDLLPTISIRCKEFRLFNDTDIDNIQRILEQGGLKPIAD